MRSMKNGEGAGPGEVYVLGHRKMEIGDIVLSTDPKGLEDLVIRAFTDGHYSHAAIYTQASLLIEATTAKDGSGGVRRTSVMRYLADDWESMRVLRLREDVPNRRAIAGEAALQAELMLHRRYWMDGACLFVLYKNLNDLVPGVIPPNKRQAFFCSHLVAEVYKLAKLDLLRGVQPEHTEPNEFLRSKKLQDVTGDVLRIEDGVTARANAPSSDESPHIQIEQAVNQRILADANVLAIVEKHGRKIPPGHEELLNILEETEDLDLDKIMAAALDDIRKGFNELFNIHRSKPEKERLYDIQIALKYGMPTPVAVQDGIYELEKLRFIVTADVAHRKADVKENENRLKKTGLRTFLKRLVFSREYLLFMELELDFIERQIALFQKHLRSCFAVASQLGKERLWYCVNLSIPI
jgi:hypothetical protein